MTVRLRSAALTAVLALLTAACSQESPTAPAEPAAIGSISAEELSQRIEANDAPLILDVRSADEFAAGHIPGAINIPHTAVEGKLGELPTDKGAEIVVHCQAGVRAGMAEEILAKAGYSGVKHLEGDFGGWKAAELPVVQ